MVTTRISISVNSFSGLTGWPHVREVREMRVAVRKNRNRYKEQEGGIDILGLKKNCTRFFAIFFIKKNQIRLILSRGQWGVLKHGSCEARL